MFIFCRLLHILTTRSESFGWKLYVLHCYINRQNDSNYFCESVLLFSIQCMNTFDSKEIERSELKTEQRKCIQNIKRKKYPIEFNLHILWSAAGIQENQIVARDLFR